jgi:hypothetical protein
VSEKDIRTALLSQPVPDEHFAEERTWETVRGAYLGREPVSRRRRFPIRLVLAVAVIGAGVAIALTPAGPRIVDWIRDTVGREQAVSLPAEKPELVALPAPGQLLVAADGAIWIVGEDGSRRRLGDYRDAVWSPTGLFVAAWSGGELVALDPEEPGFVHWRLAPDRVADVRWSSSGYRVAYRNGPSLRIIVGVGTGDKELVPKVAEIAPAWRPGREEVLAYADPSGRVVVVDVDTGKVGWRTARAPLPAALAWTDDAGRLAVLAERRLRVFEAPKKLLTTIPIPDGATGVALAARPGSHELAYTTFSATTGQGAVFLTEGKTSRLLFAGAGRFDDIAWSPDGRLLLLGWSAAGEWLYVPAARNGEVITVPDVARQFDAGGSGTPSFPRVAGWCCTRPSG